MVRVSSKSKLKAENPTEPLREPEIFIKTLQDNAPYALLVINPDLSIRYVNPAFTEMTGFTLEELIGCKPPFPWWTGDFETKLWEMKTQVLSGASSIERCNVKKNGELFWVQASGRPVLVDNQSKYFISNWVDITERKETERKLSRLNKELRNLTAHLDSIREEERGNISRMIHDEIGQALTALKMNVCWIRKDLYPDQKPLKEVSDSMVKLIDATIHKARWISTALRPVWLDELGLVDTLNWLIEEFHEMTGIKCQLDVEQNLKLDKQTSTAVYRVFQEVLTNIFRHSRATSVDVSLVKIRKQIRLRIADNGIGISRDKIESPRSFGILGMRERVDFLGGTFQIEGKKNQGTIVAVTLPVRRRLGKYAEKG
jgi:PAS domain S-box-containing protein